jgi:hypothetical protein
MTAYRAYIFDEDGHIRKAHVIYADTDEEAASEARTLFPAFEVEKWEGPRLAARLPKAE